MNKNLIDSYIDNKDWRVKENANVSFSIGGSILYNSGAVVADYWLNNIYTKEIAEAHEKASIHLHDLCFSKDARFVLENGEEISFAEAEKRGIKEAKVKSFNEKTGKVTIEQATNIGKRDSGKQELFQVVGLDGDILPPCTDYHEFYVKNKGWVKVKDLVPGDEIVEV